MARAQYGNLEYHSAQFDKTNEFILGYVYGVISLVGIMLPP